MGFTHLKFIFLRVFPNRLTNVYTPPRMVILLYSPSPPPASYLFHYANPSFSQRILEKPPPLGFFHLRATVTCCTDPPPPLRMPLTLPADWELQSPLPNLYCYRALPLVAQLERHLLLVEQNCSPSSDWSKSRVEVMQEHYFNKLLEQRDGAYVA